MDKINIRYYSTWKKQNNPDIYRVQDGVKGWAIQTVEPTIEYYGWKLCIMDANYGICDTIKPKKLAIKLLIDTWGEKWVEDKKFVYYVYYGTNQYMDVIYVWYKEKNRPDLEIFNKKE